MPNPETVPAGRQEGHVISDLHLFGSPVDGRRALAEGASGSSAFDVPSPQRRHFRLQVVEITFDGGDVERGVGLDQGHRRAPPTLRGPLCPRQPRRSPDSRGRVRSVATAFHEPVLASVARAFGQQPFPARRLAALLTKSRHRANLGGSGASEGYECRRRVPDVLPYGESYEVCRPSIRRNAQCGN